MITFEQSSKGKYVIKGDINSFINKVNNFIKEISSQEQDKFIEDCNDNLFQDIASRMIAIEFFKEHDIDQDYLTVLINYVYNNQNYSVSLGKLPDPKDPKGPVKIVESRYIN